MNKSLVLVGVVTAVVIASLVVVLVVIPSIQSQKNGNETVHIEIQIIYSASWNGSYSYTSGSLNRLVSLNGIGDKNVSLTFVGNVYSGISYSVAFQKSDNSSGTLTVTVNSDTFSSQTHSNSSAFGIVTFGRAVIGSKADS